MSSEPKFTQRTLHCFFSSLLSEARYARSAVSTAAGSFAGEHLVTGTPVGLAGSQGCVVGYVLLVQAHLARASGCGRCCCLPGWR